MKEIIPPVPRELIEAELTADKFHRKTNKAENEIYILTYHDSPNIMREIGRLRELTFRTAGGGIGEEVDIDEYDTRKEHPYKQLIVWDPSRREILGGYRYIHCAGLPRDENGEVQLATTHHFHFSDEFIEDYLPYVIELGRSFVQPDYQSSKAGAKALFALDNLWDGLGALMIDYPDIRYYFGKVTMYPQYNQSARNLILHFLAPTFQIQTNWSVLKNQCLILPIRHEWMNYSPVKVMKRHTKYFRRRFASMERISRRL